MAAIFSSDLAAPGTPLPHFWEHTIGSGHATLALRADWQAQMRRAHDEIGARYVRFHGILDDDMGTLIEQGGVFIYSFFNADQIFDFLLSIGMKPFVELSFMPGVLASGTATQFHYRANITTPRDPAAWSVLIRKLAQHWVDRYGIDEVRQWFFEVWNEPNLTAFGSGEQSDYFNLYRYTVEPIKSVDARLKVGGPATAANAWIGDFIAYCHANALPVDFISTHHYPTDAFGKPGDDTEAQPAAGTRSVLRDQARLVQQQAMGLPVYYTEWCTSSNPRDAMHDDPYAAAFIIKTVLEANGLVEAYSYWTFSDIFEENYFPSLPFHGGFGLLNIHGIAKPAYRAYQLLHGLGDTLLPMRYSHPTVDAWLSRAPGQLSRGPGQALLMLTNFALPCHPISAETITVSLANAGPVKAVSLERIDIDHANAKRHWEQIGEPEYPDAETLAALHAASELAVEDVPFDMAGDRIDFQLTVLPQSVAAVRLHY
jgi:xylan 1,4-beta-xylosidase